MEYGILVVESEDGQYQIIGPVDSVSEAKEIAQNYMAHGPANGLLAPEQFILVRRDCNGHFTRKTVLDF